MMKRMVLLLTCLALLLSCTGAFALSFSDNYPLYKVESYEPNGYCYMYNKPSSIDGRNMGRFDNGSFVKVIEWDKQNGFSYVISTDGKTGYIGSKCLTKYSDTLNRPVYRTQGSNGSGYCYMYDKPSSIDGRNLGRFDDGSLVLIVDWDADASFAKVRSWNENKYGYIGKKDLIQASGR